MHGIGQLALATLAGNPFPDATDEFFRDFQTALDRATGNRVSILHPFARLKKKDVCTWARAAAGTDVLLHRARRRPPLRPLQQVRRTASGPFVQAGVEDPTQYVDECTKGGMTKSGMTNDEVKAARPDWLNAMSFALARHSSSFVLDSLIPRSMFTVSREIDFCYGHRLLDYAGKCRHLHGHNGRVIIAFDASGLDSARHGAGLLGDQAGRQPLDRRESRPPHDPRPHRRRGDVLQEMGEPMYLMDANPTAENIAKLIFEVAAEHGFPVVEVRLWETPHCCATYRPKTICRP